MKKWAILLIVFSLGLLPVMQAYAESQEDVNKRLDTIQKDLEELKKEVLQQKETWARNMDFLSRIKLGGEVRTRWEMTNNADFDGHDTDDFFLLRTRFSIGVTPIDNVLVYIQAQDSRTWGDERGMFIREFRPGTTIASFDTTAGDEDRLDLKQGYFELQNIAGLPVTARVGRQVLSYGDERLIGAFDWSNVGRSFDAIKFIVTPMEGVQVDLWYSKVVEELNDDRLEEDDDIDFYGLYATTSNFKDLGLKALDVYGLYLRDNGFDQFAKPSFVAFPDMLTAKQHLNLWTIGVRADGVVPVLEALDYNIEAATQLGTRGGGTIHAWAVHAATGYTAKELPTTPRLGIEYNFASGDGSPDSESFNTFNNLFPTNHDKYGLIDFVNWQNMHDFSGNISAKPLENLTARLRYHYFMLAEEQDAWYGSPRPDLYFATDANSDGEDEIAQEIDLSLKYDYNKYVDLEAGYALFVHGNLIRKGFGSGRANAFRDSSGETNWGYLQARVHF